jgi:hypothetical protein
MPTTAETSPLATLFFFTYGWPGMGCMPAMVDSTLVVAVTNGFAISIPLLLILSVSLLS